MRSLLAILALAFAISAGPLILAGCKNGSLPTTNTLPKIGQGLEGIRTGAQGAGRNVEDAMPHSDAVGQGLLGSALQNIRLIIDRAGQVMADVQTAQQERDQAVAAAEHWKAERQKLYDSLPQRIWRWIIRLAWLLGALVAIHLVCGAAGLFVSGPIGAALAVVSHVVNPFAWFTAARENLWTRRFSPAAKARRKSS